MTSKKKSLPNIFVQGTTWKDVINLGRPRLYLFFMDFTYFFFSIRDLFYTYTVNYYLNNNKKNFCVHPASSRGIFSRFKISLFFHNFYYFYFFCYSHPQNNFSISLTFFIAQDHQINLFTHLEHKL